jgi:CubicO group peptidase (beta-lactamase class C family)
VTELKTLGYLTFVFTMILATVQVNAAVFPGKTWKNKSPEEVGMIGEKLEEFCKKLPTTAQVVVIKDGYMVHECGTRRHGEWASASKALMGTMLLFAIKEGKAHDVDDLVMTYGWQLEEKDESMTLRHLANMVSGYTLPEKPGRAWAYNDFGIQLYVHTILRVMHNINPASASAVSRFFTHQSRLGPLQFQDGSLFVSKKGSLRVNMTPRDFARVGLFWLSRGNWNGRQILPASYFDDVMRPQVPAGLQRTAGGTTDDYLGVGSYGGKNDQEFLLQGHYGFNWSFNRGLNGAKLWPDVPDDAFHNRGHGGPHTMLMIPSLRIVMAWNNGPVFPPGSAGLKRTNEIYRLLVEAVK